MSPPERQTSMAHSAAPAPPPAPTTTAPTAPAKKKAHSVVHFMAGGFGGMLGALVTCPLEVVKTRLQSSNHAAEMQRAVVGAQGLMVNTAAGGHGVAAAHPASTAAMARTPILSRLLGSTPTIIASIYRQEGLLALWRGLGPNLAGIIPSRAIYFFAYNAGLGVTRSPPCGARFCVLTSLPRVSVRLRARNAGKDTLIRWQGHENWRIHMGAAAVATVTVASTTAPIWMIKTRMQLQSGAGTIRCGRYARNAIGHSADADDDATSLSVPRSRIPPLAPHLLQPPPHTRTLDFLHGHVAQVSQQLALPQRGRPQGGLLCPVPRPDRVLLGRHRDSDPVCSVRASQEPPPRTPRRGVRRLDACDRQW